MIIYASVKILVSLIILIWSADRFVHGSISIANFFKINPILIGLTIVAIGTSAPEIFVAVIATLRGNPGVGIGNALGSNIANIGLVLGGTALVHSLKLKSKTLKLEMIILILITLLACYFLYTLNQGVFAGSVLLGFYLIAMVFLTYRAIKKHSKISLGIDEEKADHNIYLGVFWFFLALCLMPISSDFLVAGAIEIARYFNVSEFIIGLTIIAVGTSLPELATSIISVVKGEYELAIGNVIGSNIANLTLVLGPIFILKKGPAININMSFDLAVMLVFTFAMVIFLHLLKDKIPRAIGFLFFSSYCGYLTYLAV